MDFLEIALIVLIIFVSLLLSLGGWMVFLILKDTRKSLQKLNEVLYGNSLSATKIKQVSSSATAPTKKNSTSRSSQTQVFASRRFFTKK